MENDNTLSPKGLETNMSFSSEQDHSSHPGGQKLSPPAFSLSAESRTPLEQRSAQLPLQLQAAMEARSGMDLSDVRVHRNSPEPAALGALAYARGTDIHLAPGQDRHLPHEAWHVVQQKQGRVPATRQLKPKEGMALNDDPGLEAEADRMGETIQRMAQGRQPLGGVTGGGGPAKGAATEVVQRVAVQINPTAPVELDEETEEGNEEKKEEKKEESGLSVSNLDFNFLEDIEEEEENDEISVDPKKKEIVEDDDIVDDIDEELDLKSEENEGEEKKQEMELGEDLEIKNEKTELKEKEPLKLQSQKQEPDKGKVERIMVVGRPERLFGSSMGDHTTAYGVQQVALDLRLRGKTYLEAFQELNKMVEETRQLPGMKLLNAVQDQESTKKEEKEDDESLIGSSSKSPLPEYSDSGVKLRLKMNKAFQALDNTRKELAKLKGDEGRFVLLLQNYIGEYLEFRETVPLSVLNVKSSNASKAGKGKGERKHLKALSQAEQTWRSKEGTPNPLEITTMKLAMEGVFDKSGAAMAATELDPYMADKMAPGLGALEVKKRVKLLAEQHVTSMKLSFPTVFAKVYKSVGEACAEYEKEIIGLGSHVLVMTAEALLHDVRTSADKIREANTSLPWRVTFSSGNLQVKGYEILEEIKLNFDIGISNLMSVQSISDLLEGYKLKVPKLANAPDQVEKELFASVQAISRMTFNTDNKKMSKYGLVQNDKPFWEVEDENKRKAIVSWTPTETKSEEKTEKNDSLKEGKGKGSVDDKEKKQSGDKKENKLKRKFEENEDEEGEDKLEEVEKPQKKRELEKDQIKSKEDNEEKNPDDLALEEEMKQPLAVQIMLNKSDTITDVAMAGRTPSPFSGTMGAHTTAWVVHLDHVRKKLVNSSFINAFKAMKTLSSEALKMLQDIEKTAGKEFLPAQKSREWILCTGAKRQLEGMLQDPPKVVDTAAVFHLQSWIYHLLSFINFIPYSTVDSSDTGGKGEGTARKLLLSVENDPKSRVSAQQLKIAIYSLFDLAPDALHLGKKNLKSEKSESKKEKKEEDGSEREQKILDLLAGRHLNLIKSAYFKAYQKANPSIEELKEFNQLEKEEKDEKREGLKNKKKRKSPKKTNTKKLKVNPEDFKPLDMSGFSQKKEVKLLI